MKAAVGTAMREVWGPDWFDEGPDGFAEAEPGQYHYEDEVSYADYEFDVNADGTVTFGISYVKIDDIVTMLTPSSGPWLACARPDPGGG